ncbi:SOS response-associated peptidase [Sphingosinicella terrae]|uniref:SOS response-associated peptidase n=1 Tax=Sphingosinicella terrae TaxID=2172047 RepID=UPI000E0D4F4F|nr:SOS response-associated peptidase family protein [Sphingosinicella terrae]
MCNLYRQRATENLSRIFEASPLLDLPELRADIYPKYDAAVIRKAEGRRVIDVMAWGIVRTMPGKSGKPIAKAVTNVRNLESPFWRSTIANPAQRCLVPFTSFAEPRPGKDPATGRPANWWFHVEGAECCAFAGIWRMSEGRPRFAFLTCEPNPLVAPLHPKAMPVILAPEDYDRWLDGEAGDACALAQPFPSQLMRVA